MLKPNQTKSDF